MSIFYQNHKNQFRSFYSINNNYPTHLHKQVELIYVKEGTIEIQIDHNSYTLTKEMLIIIFPNQLHRISTPQSSSLLICIFHPDFCPSYTTCFHTQLPTHPVLSTVLKEEHSLIAITGLLKQTPSAEYSTMMIEGYLTLLLASIYHNLDLKEKEISMDLEIEQHLLQYIDSHYTEALSLDLLSKEFGLSKFSLSRIFSEHLKLSFTNYVTQKRLEYTIHLLNNTNLSITEIAFETGFGSARTFFREFKAYFNCTPKQYRTRKDF